MPRILIVLVLFFLFVEAGTYPRLFSQIGTPLYEADKVFAGFERMRPFEKQIRLYREQTARTLATGRDIESGRDVEKEELTLYFSALRVLQKEHDAIVSALTQELRSAIEKDDYDQVMIFVQNPLEPLFMQPDIKKVLVGYYKKQKHRGEIAYLEKMAEEFSGDVSKGRAKELVMLTTSWCPACKKAKTQLHSQGIPFAEYDIERSAIGKRLYKERNGHAVPIFIIGDDYRTGLSMEWIHERLE